MGKATIIEHLAGGQYSVQYNFHGHDRIAARIAEIEAQITDIQNRIDALDPDDPKVAVLEMQKSALEKMVVYYGHYMPADPVINIWCCDLTENLAGEVGTVEINGEYAGANFTLIMPGYLGNAVYDQDRDNIMQPTVASGIATTIYNLMALPGWQKWKPTFRVGQIVADSIDFVLHTCTVCLSSAFSSQLNIDINQEADWGECGVDAHSGWTQFCQDNPGHAACTNSTENGPIKVSAAMYAELESIQNDVNNSHEYETDKSGYNLGDVWAIMGAGEKGDCEDFALTKMDALITAGWPPGNLSIVTCFTETGGYHASLMIRTQDQGNLILDNRYPGIKRQDTLPYRWHLYQRAGSDWGLYSVQISNVPIEYMGCHSAAFADGDEVIIGFQGQDWSQPKVIGFVDNPKGCGADVYVFGLYCFKYDHITDSWGLEQEAPGVRENLTDLQAVIIGDDAYILSGILDPVVYDEPGMPDDTFQKYIITTRVYSVEKDVPTARQFLAAFGADNKVIATGGIGQMEIIPDKHGMSKVELYNSITNAWGTKNSMSIGRWDHYAFSIGNYGYVGGGLNKHAWETGTTFASGFYRYGIDSDSWISRSGPPTGRMWARSFSLLRKGFVISGLTRDEQTDQDTQLNETIYPNGIVEYWTFPIEENRDTQHLGYFSWAVNRYDEDANSWALAEGWPSNISCYRRNPNAGANGTGYQLGEYRESPPEGTYERGYMVSLDVDTETWSDELAQPTIEPFFNIGSSSLGAVAK